MSSTFISFTGPTGGHICSARTGTTIPSGQNRAETIGHIEDTLEALQKLVDQGKLRHFGLSNESAWGTSQWVRVAEDRGWPRVQSVQNEYSLLCRHYDTDMAEMSVNEDVTLLAFSPLAAGLLTGKYAPDVTPDGSRRSLVPDMGGRLKSGRVWPAIDAYAAIAKKHGLSLPQMALAWCRTRPFKVSAIFGATTLEQLDVALGAADVEVSDEVLQEISAAHRQHPMPY